MTKPINIITSVFNEIKKYSGTSFVILCDGIILQDCELMKSFAEDVASLQNAGINLIIVHDGSNVVGSIMDKFSLKGASANVQNTEHANIELVEMVLSGHLNQKLVSQINQAEGSAVGISGKDGEFLVARRAKVARYDHNKSNKVLNFGFLGELSFINPDILFLLEENDFMPVISPITIGDDGRTYKVDPYDIAGAISAVLSASKLIFITDCPGIFNSDGKLELELGPEQIKKLMLENKDATDLNDKFRAILLALEQNTEMAHIVNGKIPHALMIELFSNERAGTIIKSSNEI